jgi:hypothetical protein
MERLKDFLQQTRWVAIITLIIGIGLGVVYAWVIDPVEWVDAAPDRLRHEYQVDYLRMVIDSYSVNLDPELAKERYERLGENRGEILAEVGEAPEDLSPSAIQKFQALVAVESPEPETEPTEESGRLGTTAAKYVLPVCGTTLVLGLLLAVALVLRRRMESDEDQELVRPVKQAPYGIQPEEERPIVSEQPLATFRTTYSLGDDTYDDSFSVESAAGDFLGECGVGVGDVMGVGEPKKVSAFEVWLFDKNDIQTVTKVIMSHYGFHDEATRTRLAAKGDPIEAESGSSLILETATLRVEARVVDMQYGEGALPAESFFERATFELSAYRRGEGAM